jgi:hypothetical protein
VPEADEAADIEEVQDWAAELNALQARVAGPGSLGRSHAGGCWPTCALAGQPGSQERLAVGRILESAPRMG